MNGFLIGVVEAALLISSVATTYETTIDFSVVQEQDMEKGSNEFNVNKDFDINEEVGEVYADFLNGNKEAVIEGSNEKIGIFEMTTPTGEPDKKYASWYTLFDLDEDGIKELHIRTPKDYYVLSYEGDELFVYIMGMPLQLLDNGAFLYLHLGGAPSHEDYKYFVLDNQEKLMLQAEFSRYDSNLDVQYDEQDEYFFQGEKVTMEDWDTLTAQYLLNNSDKIRWITLYSYN